MSKRSCRYESRTPEERVSFLIKHLLTGVGKIDLVEMAENILFVSEGSLRKDLFNVRKKAGAFGLRLVTRDTWTVTIEGSEGGKRRMLCALLYEEFNENVLSIRAIASVFPAIDIYALHNIIIESCKRKNIFLNEYSLLTLLLELAVSLDRVKSGFVLRDVQRTRADNTDDFASGIADEIERHYGVVYNDAEQEELRLILAGNIMQTQERAGDCGNEEEERKFTQVMDALGAQMSNYPFIDVSNEAFMSRFAVHISNLLPRLKSGYVRKNPLAEHLRNTCPMLFDCAVCLSDVINKTTGANVDENETAYIALHLGALLEEQTLFLDKIPCTMIFPEYYDYRERFIKRLSEISDDIVIQNVLVSIDDMNTFNQKGAVENSAREHAELVLSTIALPADRPLDYVRITPFLNSRDAEAIREKTAVLKHERKKQKLKSALRRISSPKLFVNNQSFKNQDEAIRFMASRMIEEGYADESFTDAVLEREKSFSTAYGAVAVPHSVKPDAKKTGMFILINEKSVPWQDGAVNIVLLFSISREDTALFYDIFDNLVVLLLEPAVLARLARCRAYEDFVTTILDCF